MEITWSQRSRIFSPFLAPVNTGLKYVVSLSQKPIFYVVAIPYNVITALIGLSSGSKESTWPSGQNQYIGIHKADQLDKGLIRQKELLVQKQRGETVFGSWK